MRAKLMTDDAGTILLVEDNEDDVFIFTRSYRQTKLLYSLRIATDGQEAVNYLLGSGEFADRAKYPVPFLVLIDLKLPIRPGLDVLQALQAIPALTNVCIAVLTSSAEPRDIIRARERGAEAFLVKPPAPKTITSIVAAARFRLESPGAPLPKVAGNLFDVDLQAASDRSAGKR